MQITTLPQAPMRTRELPPPPQPPEPPQEPKHRDGFSLSHSVSKGVMAFMGRRIPSTTPEVTPERSQEITSKMKPGDVILTADMSYPGWQRMEFWTVRSDYTHAAMLGTDGNVYEAVDVGTQAVPLDKFFEGRLKIAVIRHGLTPEEAGKATDFLQKNLHKRYDGAFDTNSDAKFYCSEYVGKAIRHATDRIQVPERNLLKKNVISVDAFRHMPGAEMIHDEKSNYWKNKLAYWPLGASAVACGVAGGLLGGAGGAALGGLGGLVGSILVGNKIQTGHMLPSIYELRHGHDEGCH